MARREALSGDTMSVCSGSCSHRNVPKHRSVGSAGSCCLLALILGPVGEEFARDSLHWIPILPLAMECNSAEVSDHLRADVRSGRVGRPEEVMKVAVFLPSTYTHLPTIGTQLSGAPRNKIKAVMLRTHQE